MTDPFASLTPEELEIEALKAAEERKYRRMDNEEFLALVDKYDLQTGDIDFSSNDHDDSGKGRDPLNTEKLIEERPAIDSNSFSSRIRKISLNGEFAKLRAKLLETEVITSRKPSHDEKHLPIFDIDHSVLSWETTTPGHYHLVIDRPMSESHYLYLLDAMVKVGLVQEGYARASRKRKAAWLRMPWTKKPRKAPL